ncbi:MarR family winged helix-turn-helix transcriptional regulator [Pseudactinotalea sp.]|uniref:MarR family winged helix-turn-helix transcriptional regulator n=1 Tax=Pseudactinotalea sp. TaxID=1926260 RepID=UPI003B3B4878
MTEPEPDASELIVRAARSLRRRWMASLEPWGITPHEYRALHVTTHEEPPRLSEIADRLRIAPRSATEVVDSLEAKGLVRRVPSPTDRRAVLVEPTDAGRTLAEEVAQQRSDLGEQMLAPLAPDDVAQLRDLLTRVVDDRA